MKLIIDIPDGYYSNCKDWKTNGVATVDQCIIANGKPLANITDEQISDAFQIAIANYWEEKSKHLTPPPTPCKCPIQENPICTEHQTESLISRYQNDFMNKGERI